MRRACFIVLSLLIALPGIALPAGAQTARKERTEKPEPEAPKVAPGAPPYEATMVRLSEVMGALHYLRTLCKSAEAADWRREMQALLEAEAASPERRERLIGAFNRGYAAYEQTYRACTPTAEVAVSRYLDEGKSLVRELTTRYTN